MNPDSAPFTLNPTPSRLKPIVIGLVILSHQLVRALAGDDDLVKEGFAQSRREVEEADLTSGRNDVFDRVKHLLVYGRRYVVGEFIGLTVAGPFDGEEFALEWFGLSDLAVVDDGFVLGDVIVLVDEMGAKIIAERGVDDGREPLEDDLTVSERLVGGPVVL